MEFLSTAPLPSIAISLFVVLGIAAIFLRKKKKKYPPVAGTVIHQLINAVRLHHYMTELACKYRTYRMVDLFRFAVYTVDPANIEYILKTNFPNYGKGLYLYNILSDVLRDGIVAVDGEKWRHQRKVASSEFSNKVIRDYSSEILKTNAVKLARIISEAVNHDEAIEIQDLFTKATLDSIVKVLLGIDLDTLSGNEEGIQFSKAFERAFEAVIYRLADISWKMKRFLNIGREAVLRKNMIVVDKFLYKLVKSKIETIGNSEDDQPYLKKRDLISAVLKTEGDTDPKYLRDMVLFFIVGGKDTVATGLSWFVYMMCEHPHIQEKIAQEVRIAIGLNNASSADEVAANLTEEALGKMQYLHATLAETLRLYPPVPMDGRVCFADDTLPDGFSIKKGELVAYKPFAMGLMKFLWGDDAEEFRPDRWLDENGIFHEESPFKFTTFHAGPRICPGKKYGYMQMKIFSAVLLGTYIFKMSDENKNVNYKSMFTLHIDGGLYVHASPRFEHGRQLQY
ncbi:hypothetical protein ACLB2K_071180 [Fragaria x ananassa]